MYKYETHLHTYPVSKCAKVSVRESLEFYKRSGYDGVFITNHFLDGNINIDSDAAYEEKVKFYFSDYEEALRLSKEVEIQVFCGVEMTYKGTDFLIYGLDKKWYMQNPQIMEMSIIEKLIFLAQSGAFIVQAHPYRETTYIRLFHKFVHGVEVFNACRTESENKMAEIYADNYGLIKFSGSDNHRGENIVIVSGMSCKKRISCEQDFIDFLKNGEMKIIAERIDTM